MMTTAILQGEETVVRSPGVAWRRRLLVVGSDVATLTASLVVAASWSAVLSPPVWAYVLYGLSMWGFMGAAQLYNSRLATDRSEELPRVAKSGFRALVLLGTVVVLVGQPVDLRVAMVIYGCTIVGVSAEREGLRLWFASRRKSGHALWPSVLVASRADSEALRTSIDSNDASPHVIADVIDPDSCGSGEEILAKTIARARATGARGVVVDEASLDRSFANGLVRGLLEAQLFVDLASPVSDISTERLASRNLGPSVGTWIAPRPRTGWRARAKRVFDVTLTVVGGLALTPVWLSVAVAVKLSSPGPVLFRQERVGRDEEPFGMLKFRSMVVDAEDLLDKLEVENEGAGPLFKMKADPRVTRVGRFIRKTSLDELPQLLNVLRNEMSLVGPRPALRSEMADWDADLHARLQVKPGITGMWQVSGRSTTTFDEYTRLDLYYVHNWSLRSDLSILARTIPAVLKSDGAY